MRAQEFMTFISQALLRLSHPQNFNQSCQPHVSSTPSIQDFETRNTIRSFLSTFSCSDCNTVINVHLLQAVLDNVASWNIPNAAFPQKARLKLANLSASFAEMCYACHSFELQVQIAMYTFLIIYIDDQAERVQTALGSFQRRMMLGLPQLDPFLAQFSAILADMYKFYDPISANSIIASTLEFISGCVLETHRDILSMKSHRMARNWPNFLRTKTGVSAAYAYLIFPLAEHRNMANYIQAIPDIMDFINLTNDVLSFYKEELSGETSNYIHNRARANEKPPVLVHAEVAEEAETACFAISGILQANEDARRSWSVFYKGYISWHVGQDRYKLSQIGL